MIFLILESTITLTSKPPTETIKTTKLLEPSQKPVFFECNFDDGMTCGGATILNSLNLAVRSQYYLQSSNQVVTDVSSISEIINHIKF